MSVLYTHFWCSKSSLTGYLRRDSGIVPDYVGMKGPYMNCTPDYVGMKGNLDKLKPRLRGDERQCDCHIARLRGDERLLFARQHPDYVGMSYCNPPQPIQTSFPYVARDIRSPSTRPIVCEVIYQSTYGFTHQTCRAHRLPPSFTAFCVHREAGHAFSEVSCDYRRRCARHRTDF